MFNTLPICVKQKFLITSQHADNNIIIGGARIEYETSKLLPHRKAFANSLGVISILRLIYQKLQRY